MTDAQILRIQKQQLQSLNHIYLSDLQILRNNFPSRFTILCKPFAEIGEDQYKAKIVIEYTKQYPRNKMRFEIQPIVGITQDNITAMERKIDNIIENNLNRPIIYDIVEAARDWMQQFLVEGKNFADLDLQDKVVEEVFERPKYATYTPVTMENFLAWKKQFEAEMNQAKRKKQLELDEKLSGKQWFMKNKEIAESDDEEDEQEQVEDQEQKQLDKLQQQVWKD